MVGTCSMKCHNRTVFEGEFWKTFLEKPYTFRGKFFQNKAINFIDKIRQRIYTPLRKNWKKPFSFRERNREKGDFFCRTYPYTSNTRVNPPPPLGIRHCVYVVRCNPQTRMWYNLEYQRLKYSLHINIKRIFKKTYYYSFILQSSGLCM